MKTIVRVLILTALVTAEVVGQNSFVPDDQIEKTTFTYKQVENLKIQADLYRIRADKSLKPVIVWIHGGALIFGSRDDLSEEQMKLYLDAGYSVISIDYRLAPETKLREIVSDVKDAIVWIRSNGEKTLGIDPNNIFIIGHSAGAYLALMTGYILDTPPKGIVSFYGYGDILGDWYNKPDAYYRTWDLIKKEDADKMIGKSMITNASFYDRFDFYIFCRQNGLWTKIVSHRDPIKNHDELAYYCPVKNIHPKYPPTLLIHGDQDTDVPFLQSQLIEKELAENSVQHKLITMKGYDHVFDIMKGGLGNEDIRKAFNEVIDFLDKH
ncbi:alpha/beta hydrolase [Fulvivirgaceae bacterium BMA10]|uniref:Alpha/beta hydrolase n=1 Tax=Splendidivirga corallicola TaxID=3051826 RepID=A0ABT8KRG9_9BACT|nr:alpha/beta hydrolase [Fulvivirgaceae bacterium BMA10]